MTDRQKQALDALRRSEQSGTRLTVRELALQLGVGPATAHGLLRRLVAAGGAACDTRASRQRSRAYRSVDANVGQNTCAICLFREGGGEHERATPEVVVADPTFFRIGAPDSAFGILLSSSRQVADFDFSTGDILILRRGFPPKKDSEFLVGAVIDGTWRIGGFNPTMRDTHWLQVWMSPRAERVARSDGIVRGFAIGFLTRRGGRFPSPTRRREV